MISKGDSNLFSQVKSAVALLMRHYQYGSYRVIRDPEGVVSLWAIEGSPNAPFSISFFERGRGYNRIEDIPIDFLKSFLEHVRKPFR
jgi:hypothetical protein